MVERHSEDVADGETRIVGDTLALRDAELAALRDAVRLTERDPDEHALADREALPLRDADAHGVAVLLLRSEITYVAVPVADADAVAEGVARVHSDDPGALM